MRGSKLALAMRATFRGSRNLECRIFASPDRNAGKHNLALYSGGSTLNEIRLFHRAQRSAGWSGVCSTADAHPAFIWRQVWSNRRAFALVRQKMTPEVTSGNAAGAEDNRRWSGANTSVERQ